MWMRRYAGELEIELKQARDEGKRVPEAALAQAERVRTLDLGSAEANAAAAALMDEIESLPVAADFSYDEPDELLAIRTAAGPAREALASAVPDYDHIYGAWLGRAAGCLLGNPVEGWRRDRLIGFLRDTGNLPIRQYLRCDGDADARARYAVDGEPFRVYNGQYLRWIDRMYGPLEDDDTNYTILSLQLLEDYGWEFTSEDVAECWLNQLPPLRTYTAERNAVCALLAGAVPPGSARHRNPMREWIGAAIRADLYGYVAPGDPTLAADMAWRDARVSHVKNGVYAAMWIAAMLSAAAVERDMVHVVKMGLGQIPAKCRLAERIGQVLYWRQRGDTAAQALEQIHAMYSDADPHCAVHAIANEMIVAVALLWGECELGATIGLAVEGALDTDCNGATAGSVVGMALGARALPEAWVAPLGDRLGTRVDAQGDVALSALAARTLRVAVEQRPGRKRGI